MVTKCKHIYFKITKKPHVWFWFSFFIQRLKLKNYLETPELNSKKGNKNIHNIMSSVNHEYLFSVTGTFSNL